MNKRTVILLAILVLLVLTVFNRWDVWFHNDGIAQIRFDRLSMQTQIANLKEKPPNMVAGNKYLLHGTTAFLYSAIAVVTVALLIEARRKDSEDEKRL